MPGVASAASFRWCKVARTHGSSPSSAGSGVSWQKVRVLPRLQRARANAAPDRADRADRPPPEASGYSLVACARLQCCPAKRSRGSIARQPSLHPTRRPPMPCAPQPRRGWRGARPNAPGTRPERAHACGPVACVRAPCVARHSFRSCLVPAGCCARGRAKMRSKPSARLARSVRNGAGCLSRAHAVLPVCAALILRIRGSETCCASALCCGGGSRGVPARQPSSHTPAHGPHIFGGRLRTEVATSEATVYWEFHSCRLAVSQRFPGF